MADDYRDILGADIREVDKQTYLGFLDPARGCGATWQLEYDRLFDRAVDNSKILKLAGLTQADLTPVKTALEAELSRLPRDYRFPGGEDICRRMDAYR